ncbi:MAG: sensor histidine kinase [Verrucomicrobiota bacterium]
MRSKTAGALAALLLLGFVGWVDYVTGYDVFCMVFYILPIFIGLRYVGTAFGFTLSILAALVWLWADLAARQQYSGWLIPVWNTCIIMSIFVMAVMLFSSRDYLRTLVEQRTEKLRDEIRERLVLEKQLLEIAEAEQRRIGHDLHDSLGQHLTATAMAGKLLAKKLAAQAAVGPAAAADRVVAMVESAIELTRNLAHSLHPIELGKQGLIEALQSLAGSLSRAFNISCQLEACGPVSLNDPAGNLHLYRIAQEAASNAIRHGHARNVVIGLKQEAGKISLSVTDDGTGLLAESTLKKGMGLRIMQFRAIMIGATFKLENLPGGGARAVCVLDAPKPGSEIYAIENKDPGGGRPSIGA